MPIELTAEGLRKILPRAPQDILDAFLAKQDVLDKAGLSHTRTRLTYFVSNLEHESGGFTIKKLTENKNYSHARAAQIWSGRFPGGADQVRDKYGSQPGWQDAMFDDVYGRRMGNRPGTRDGSTFIGHGGPQWTGRDGHEALARILCQLVPGLAGMTAEQAIDYAISHTYQPEVCVAFWMWKNLNTKADVGDFRGCVRIWNGGLIGIADREALLAGNDPFIARLANVERIMPVAKAELPGAPPTAAPPPEVIDQATDKERKTRKGGGVLGAGGAGNEGAKATTEQPAKPDQSMLLSSEVAYGAIAVGVVVIVVATILIARKKAAVVANWF